MIQMEINSQQFRKDMQNFLDYSIGYLDGINIGKQKFFDNLGKNVIEIIKQYIDSNARVNPKMLHHVYEWYKVGSPDARLFDITYKVNNAGLNFSSNFRQSTTMQNGSHEPFYDKAKIMEEGTPVTIEPKKADVLVFETDGETIFTKSPVTVDRPGGQYVKGSFQNIMDSFFTKYFAQSFLKSSGISDYLENQTLYKKNINEGKRAGRAKGLDVGYRWIANAGIVSG